MSRRRVVETGAWLPVWLQCGFRNPRNHKGNPMKHTTDEMLLAHAVLSRALDLRKARIFKMTDAEAAEYRKQPIGDLLSEAMAELEDVATFIAEKRR